jgi:hypothetical protein
MGRHLLVLAVASFAMGPETFLYARHLEALATSAAQAGVSTLNIRTETGHASDAMLSRDGQLFTGNAAGMVL